VSSLSASSAPSVVVDDVSVTYRTMFDRRPTLRGMVRSLGRGEKVVREVQAVKHVSFSIPHGTVLGIVGANGAGKSTLVRTIAGILPPTSGRIDVYGRVSTLLALGVGFNRNLSGRDNVRLGGLAAGLHREQLAEKYDEIVRFAELGEFMDMPMRTYSSGMYGRLAFSVAVNMDPDILIVDEALAVGDAAFQRKCMDWIEGFRRHGTLLFVSHTKTDVMRLCRRAIWIDDGRIRDDGKPVDVVRSYARAMETEPDDMKRFTAV
jgi:ABC-type polysaccharide/polyol phosphate transport system ATPase subunit